MWQFDVASMGASVPSSTTSTPLLSATTPLSSPAAAAALFSSLLFSRVGAARLDSHLLPLHHSRWRRPLLHRFCCSGHDDVDTMILCLIKQCNLSTTRTGRGACIGAEGMVWVRSLIRQSELDLSAARRPCEAFSNRGATATMRMREC